MCRKRWSYPKYYEIGDYWLFKRQLPYIMDFTLPCLFYSCLKLYGPYISYSEWCFLLGYILLWQSKPPV